jgi:hypothetical protein
MYEPVAGDRSGQAFEADDVLVPDAHDAQQPATSQADGEIS